MYLLQESPTVSIPKKIKTNKEKITMEVILQTVDDVNNNKRRYRKKSLQESLEKVMPRIKSGVFLGELDHPLDSAPARQFTVLGAESSHLIKEVWWENNLLKAIVETLQATPKGCILRDLVLKDNIPVGFSYRGAGDLKEINENGQRIFEVCGPLITITWDSVTNPSHSLARMVKVNETDYSNIRTEAINLLTESASLDYTEKNGLICTPDGVCYLPNAFDRLVEQRVVKIKNKFRI